MDTCPESVDGKEVEFEPHFGNTIQAVSLHRDGQVKELTGDQGDNSKSGKVSKYQDNETGFAASDNKMKDLENNPYLDHKEMKVENPRAIDHKDSGYMTDFNGEKDDLNLVLSNSVQKIHTEQDGSCGGQKKDGNSICVTCEFDDRMVEDEVEHAFCFENKKTRDRIGFDVGISASEGHQEVFKNDNINEESDVNNFIRKTCFIPLINFIWKSLCILPRLMCMDGDVALNDGPTSASSEFTQGINSEHRHKILVQRDVQDLKHQQKPDIMSKINQDELNRKMNWNTSKNWDKIYDLDNWTHYIINILVYVIALVPRQNDGSNLVTETSLSPTDYHSVDRQVDGHNVLAAASQTVDGHPNGRDSSNNSSQEPQRGMNERINDPLNSPAILCNDKDIGFTDVHLASGRVTEEDSDPTHPSAPVHESDLNISMEPLRVSDVSGMTSLPQARSQHSSVDTSCRDEGDDNGFQTDAGRHASDLSHLPVTEQAADGNLFHIATARSTRNEQPSEVNRINNTPASPVNSHGESGDPGSIKLQATRSTDPGNRSTKEQTYTVRVPARTSNEDDNSANAVEMASMNLASGGIRNTKDKMASQKFQRTHRRKRCQSEEEDLDILSHTEVQTVLEDTLEHHPDGAEKSCAYCSKKIRVTNATRLKNGQHISLQCQSTAGSGKLHRHHAIIKKIISCLGNSIKLRLIHFSKQNGKIKIYETIESYDLTIHKLCIIKYIHPRYSPEQIIRRAEQVLNTYGEGKFDSYNLLTCNCEHFATWCVVGKEESFQVQTRRVVFENVLKFVFGGNAKITEFLLKACFMSSDEIASAMTQATATPVVILAGSVIAYCIYCIYFAFSLCKQFSKDHAICKSCLIKNLAKLRTQFVVYIGTSSLTFWVQCFVLPGLTPMTGIPLLVLLLVASTLWMCCNFTVPLLLVFAVFHFFAAQSQTLLLLLLLVIK